jgi:sodium-independent sulfate anion transporter 11
MPKWLVGDAIAGISVGLLLVPQAVTYSALAGVPIQTALLSSWLPGMIYTVTGTSKGMLYYQSFLEFEQ